MRICILGNAQSPHIQRWALFFDRRGHQVLVVSARPGKIPGVRVHTPKLPFERWLRRDATFDEDRTPDSGVYASLIALALTVRRIVRRFDADLVMALTMETNGVLAMLAGRHPTALFHLGPKALSLKSETSLIVRLLVKAMIRFSDMLYTGDSAGVARLRELGAPSEKIYVNPWGIDRSKLADEAEAAELRERLGVGDARLFVCMRVFLPEYDVATYLRAVPLIAAKDSDARFVVVGDGPERERLRVLAEDLNIGDRVQFVGYVPYRALFTYARAADFYVDPLNFDLPQGRTWWGHRIRASMDGTGYSITLLIALASGCIPLVTLRAGLSDIFDERRRRQLLWDRGEPGDLAARAVELLADGEECASIRRELTELARERFDWERNARRAEQEFAQMVEAHQGAVRR